MRAAQTLYVGLVCAFDASVLFGGPWANDLHGLAVRLTPFLLHLCALATSAGSKFLHKLERFQHIRIRKHYFCAGSRHGEIFQEASHSI